jgi:hypothetical protein
MTTTATIDPQASDEPEKTTRSGLAVLDPKPHLEQGRADVDAQIGDVTARAQAEGTKDAWLALLRATTAILDKVDSEVATVRPQRDNAMLTLDLLDRRRGVNQAAGIGETTFREMRQGALGTKKLQGLTARQKADRARRRGLRRVPNAEGVLAEVAPKVLVLNARRERAGELRRTASLAAHAAGMTAAEFVEVTGLSEARLWQWHAEEQKRRKAVRT